MLKICKKNFELRTVVLETPEKKVRLRRVEKKSFI
jgi:hypothetical protein